MHDITAYKAQVLTALRAATGVTVYDGEVPDVVPLDSAGFIRPYVVFFSSDGDALEETDLSGVLDLAGLRWESQTTTVAATPDICSRVGQIVRTTMTNFPLGTYHILPSPLGYGTAPIKDTNISPARYFIPRMWRLDTT